MTDNRRISMQYHGWVTCSVCSEEFVGIFEDFKDKNSYICNSCKAKFQSKKPEKKDEYQTKSFKEEMEE